jgi:6-phosphogluconate dehydrogenase
VQTALDLGVPVGGVAEAVFGRAVSSKRGQRDAVRALNIPRPQAPSVDDSFVDDVAKALYASKMVAYAQGFDAIIAGAEKYGWNIDKGAVAKIWRGGCIIRAQFLNVLADAYAENPNLATLLEAPYFAQAIRDGDAAWRRVVITATQAGVPVPGFATALSYFDSLNVDRLPAALVQGQRDFFGAHTYKRVDKAGTFHTLWSGDRSEVQTD